MGRRGERHAAVRQGEGRGEVASQAVAVSDGERPPDTIAHGEQAASLDADEPSGQGMVDDDGEQPFRGIVPGQVVVEGRAVGAEAAHRALRQDIQPAATDDAASRGIGSPAVDHAEVLALEAQQCTIGDDEEHTPETVDGTHVADGALGFRQPFEQ